MIPGDHLQSLERGPLDAFPTDDLLESNVEACKLKYSALDLSRPPTSSSHCTKAQIEKMAPAMKRMDKEWRVRVPGVPSD